MGGLEIIQIQKHNAAPLLPNVGKLVVKKSFNLYIVHSPTNALFIKLGKV